MATPAKGVVWGFFCFTSFHLAFLQPYLNLVPQERSKVFSGVLCAITIGAAWIVFAEKRPSFRSLGLIVSLLLGCLIALSCMFSLTPYSSSWRGFVIFASSFGGFWCARFLLDTRPSRIVFVWFCTILLTGIIAMCLIGYAGWHEIDYLIDSNPHPVADRMMLLFFAPLTLILGGGKFGVLAGATLFVLSYVVFYLSSLRSAMLIPLVLGALAVLLGALRVRYFIAVMIPLAVVIVMFFQQLPSFKIGPEFEPAYYRAENYPFSWHIAAKHPWLGIGLRAPRDQFLQDYEVKYPYVTKEKFAESVNRVVSSENTFLSFMAELGIPFVVLYSLALGWLLLGLIRWVRISYYHYGADVVPPIALLMSVVAGFVHFHVLDGLFHPQISWFFHILLGMIPAAILSPSSLSKR